MEKEIQEIFDKGITNPSGIVSCLYMRGHKGLFGTLRGIVIKEIDRLKKL